MFSGLVWPSCLVSDLILDKNKSRTLAVDVSDPRAQHWQMGDSVAINGVCLTIVRITSDQKFYFEVSPETLSCTTFSNLKVGTRVHVEPAMSLGDKIGGHLVSGHVDGVAPLSTKESLGDYWKLEFKLEGAVREAVAPYLVSKGSICIDGVSLTVNHVKDTVSETFFDVMIIPHTFKVTTLGSLNLGDLVNLEADLLAKYVSRTSRYYDKRPS